MDCALWLGIVAEQLESARSLAERALAQVDDPQFARLPSPGANSLALLVHHVGGNLRSRWTEFLSADGEKADRERDREFEEGLLSRTECMVVWERGRNAWARCARWGAATSSGATPPRRALTVRSAGRH